MTAFDVTVVSYRKFAERSVAPVKMQFLLTLQKLSELYQAGALNIHSEHCGILCWRNSRMQVSTYYVLKVFGQSIMVKVIVVMITVKLVGIDLLRRLKENE